MKTKISLLISWLVPAGPAQAWGGGVATQQPFSGADSPLVRLPMTCGSPLLVSDERCVYGLGLASHWPRVFVGLSVLCLDVALVLLSRTVRDTLGTGVWGICLVTPHNWILLSTGKRNLTFVYFYFFFHLSVFFSVMGDLWKPT